MNFTPNCGAVNHSPRNYCSSGKRIKAIRKWESIRPESDEPGFTFTFMSYNILAQDLLDKYRRYYHNHKPKDLDWKTRRRNIFEELNLLTPDIMCLQEVQESFFNKYKRLLESIGYKTLYKRRNIKRSDGCAICFKHESFSLINHSSIEFIRSWEPIYRDFAGLVAKFETKKSTSKELVVGTVHLLNNPERDDIRLVQMQLLLAEIDKLSYKGQDKEYSHLPVIIGGDLNAKPDSNLYKKISSGKIVTKDFLEKLPASYTNISKIKHFPNNHIAFVLEKNF